MPKILIRLCMGCGSLFYREVDAAPGALCPHCGHEKSEMVDATSDASQATLRIEKLSQMRSRPSPADFAA